MTINCLILCSYKEKWVQGLWEGLEGLLARQGWKLSDTFYGVNACGRCLVALFTQTHP